MTGAQFARWLLDMQSSGLALTEAKALAALGLRPDQGARYKRNGTPRRAIDLACAALLAGVEPYGAAPDRHIAKENGY